MQRSISTSSNKSYNCVPEKRKAITTIRYQATEPNAISLDRNCEVNILQEDTGSSGWAWVSADGKIGWFPSMYLVMANTDEYEIPETENTYADAERDQTADQYVRVDPSTTPKGRPSPPSRKPPPIPTAAETPTSPGIEMSSQRMVVAIQKVFGRKTVNELSCESGECLTVIDEPPDEPDCYMVRNAKGESGLMPKAYVKPRNIGVSSPSNISAGLRFPKTPNSPQPTLKSPEQGNTNFLGRKTSDGRVQVLPPMTTVVPPQRLPKREIGDAESMPRAGLIAHPFSNKPWFYENIDRTKAEQLLMSEGSVGDYIVRASASDIGQYAIEVRDVDRVRRFKVTAERGKVITNQWEFGDFDALLDHFRTSPVFVDTNNPQRTLCLKAPLKT